MSERKTHSLAVASLVLGIIGFVLGVLAGIPAIVTGHAALRKIQESEGHIDGKPLALAGVVLGYVSFLWSFALVFIGVVILRHLAGSVSGPLQKSLF